MKRMQMVLIAVAVAVVVVVVAIVILTRTDDDGPETIKIGIAGPITGAYAKFGEQLVHGTEVFIEKINAAGGIGGLKLEIVLGDDACEAKQARAVANRLVNAGVYAVIGHFCSSSTIPASEVYNEADILMITPASTNPKITERGLTGIIRACFRDDQQGNFAGDYIATELKPKKVAIIHDKDTYGQGLADATRARLKDKHGIVAVLYEGVTRGDKDFNALVTKMKGLGVDMIYFGGLHTEAALIVRQAREQGLEATFMSGDGLATQEFAQLAGRAADGVLMTFAVDPTALPAAKAVVEEFRSRNIEPEGWTLYSYLAAEVVAKALEGTNLSRKGTVLGAYIKSHTIDTIMGPQEWDAKGDPKVAPIAVYRWEPAGDTYTYVQLH